MHASVARTKIRTSLWLFFFVTLSVCNLTCKDRDEFEPMCTIPECETYFKVWKDLFLKESKMSEAYFNKHIIVRSKNITFNTHIPDFFNVSFTHLNSWININVFSSIAIRLRENEETYPYLNIPKNVFLQEEDLAKIIKINAFFSSFTVVNPIDSLPFNNMREMQQFIRNSLLLSNLTVFDGVYRANSFFNERKGNPSFDFTGTLMVNPNNCVVGFYDLDTLSSNTISCR